MTCAIVYATGFENAGLSLKICHVNLARGYRGGERQTWLLVMECVDRYGSDHVLLVCSHGSVLEKKASAIPGLFIVPIKLQISGHWRVARLRPSLVHAHEARAVHWAWLYHKLAGTPYVITRRVQDALKEKWLTRASYSCASKVVAISTAVLNDLMRFRDDGVVIASCVPSRRAASLNAIRSSRSILVAGALSDPHKGQSVAIEALLHLPKDWTLKIVGDGPDRQMLDAMISAHGLNQRAVIMPWNDRVVEQQMVESEYFVMPSRHEGLGSILLDALGSRCLVVASNVGGIPDLIVNRVTGLLVPPGDPVALAKALIDLDKDEVLKVRLTEDGEKLAQKFTPQVMMARYESLYREILND